MKKLLSIAALSVVVFGSTASQAQFFRRPIVVTPVVPVYPTPIVVPVYPTPIVTPIIPVRPIIVNPIVPVYPTPVVPVFPFAR